MTEQGDADPRFKTGWRVRAVGLRVLGVYHNAVMPTGEVLTSDLSIEDAAQRVADMLDRRVYQKVQPLFEEAEKADAMKAWTSAFESALVLNAIRGGSQ